MRRLVAVCVVIALAVVVAIADDEPMYIYKPKDGYVPDAETAIAIAVAVWNPIYGKDHIAHERPYRATLSNGIWTVVGSLPRGYVGGVAEAEIAQDDGRILGITHGK